MQKMVCACGWESGPYPKNLTDEGRQMVARVVIEHARESTEKSHHFAAIDLPPDTPER